MRPYLFPVPSMLHAAASTLPMDESSDSEWSDDDGNENKGKPDVASVRQVDPASAIMDTTEQRDGIEQKAPPASSPEENADERKTSDSGIEPKPV